MSREDQMVDLLDRLRNKPSKTVLKSVIAVTYTGVGVLLYIEEKDRFDGIENFFDGIMLEDNLTDHKNIPKEPGVYMCNIIINSFRSNIPEDPVEYDVNIWIEDVEQLSLIPNNGK